MARSTPDLMPCASTGGEGLGKRTREKNYTLEEVTWVGLVVAALHVATSRIQYTDHEFGIADADGSLQIVERLARKGHQVGHDQGTLLSM